MSEHPLAADRQRQILATLQQDGSVSVGGLARALGVTATTIRRDINHLAERGALVRVHGGATLAPPEESIRRPGRSSLTVTLAVPTDDFHWGAIVTAIRAAARSTEVGLRVHRAEVLTPELLDELARESPDGWLLAPPLDHECRGDVDDWLDRCAAPVVLLEREPTLGVGRGVQSVISDHPKNAATVVHHLADLGHRRIGLMIPAGNARAGEYVVGWELALQRLQLVRSPVLPSIDIIDPSRAELTDRVVTAIRAAGHTAVLVVGDPHAMVLLQICQEVGIAVPHDLSVVAFGDYMATWGRPALTAFRPAYETLGATALRLLLTRIRGGSVPAGHHVRLEGALVPRATVAPPPNGSAG